MTDTLQTVLTSSQRSSLMGAAETLGSAADVNIHTLLAFLPFRFKVAEQKSETHAQSQPSSSEQRSQGLAKY